MRKLHFDFLFVCLFVSLNRKEAKMNLKRVCAMQNIFLICLLISGYDKHHFKLLLIKIMES